MYEVVGCSACHALWIRSGDAETATCPRCGKTHQVDKLRTLATRDSAEAARDARSQLLVAKSDEDPEDVAGYASLLEEVEESGVSDDEYLAAHGIDPDRITVSGETAPITRNRQETVRYVLEVIEEPTREEIARGCEGHGVPREAAMDILDRLERAGTVIEEGGHYREI